MQRIRVTFGKDGSMQYTGHLDLARAWARLLRRARIPIAYSKGFNPQPRTNLAAALPLGFSSECELIDIWLDETVELDSLLDRMRAAAPPGLTITSVQEVDLKAKSTQSKLAAIEYRVNRLPLPADMEQRIAQLLAAESLPRERRGKQYDLRPLVEAVWLAEDGHELGMRLTARPGGTGRPDEVLLALDLDPLAAQIHRTRMLFTPGSAANGQNENEAQATTP